PYFREWDTYIETKEAEAEQLKWVGPGELEARYVFMRLKLEAIVSAARRFLGPKGAQELRRLYETKAIENILADTSGRR
ncbi:MAG: hypothetical protein ACM3L6_01775, partial [Deltaproteobacteria bacterium]